MCVEVRVLWFAFSFLTPQNEYGLLDFAFVTDHTFIKHVFEDTIGARGGAKWGQGGISHRNFLIMLILLPFFGKINLVGDIIVFCPPYFGVFFFVLCPLYTMFL